MPHFEHLTNYHLDAAVVKTVVNSLAPFFPHTAPEYVDVILSSRHEWKSRVYRLLDLYGTRNPTSTHNPPLHIIILTNRSPVELGFTPQEEFLAAFSLVVEDPRMRRMALNLAGSVRHDQVAACMDMMRKMLVDIAPQEPQC